MTIAPSSAPATRPGRGSARSASPRRSTRRGREGRIGWLFLTPFLLVFAITFVIPILVSVRASVYRDQASGGGLYGGGETVSTFVGVQNYREVLTGDAFWSGLGRVILFGAVQIPVMIGLALLLALLLDSLVIRRVGAIRMAYFLPYAIPGVIAALVWTYIYSPQLSPINKALEPLGGSVDFFGSNVILASMANMTTWTFTGYNMLIFLAALQAIPRELYEAARMDGAGEWRMVRSIKVPLVAPAALLAVLLSIIGTIQLFNEPTVLATVNPWMGKDYTPMMFAYGSMSGQVSPSGSGPASAISVSMAVVAGLLAVGYAVLQARVTRRMR